MIPLRSTKGVALFPRASALLLAFFFMFYLAGRSRPDLLLSWAFVPSEGLHLRVLLSNLAHATLFSLFVTMIFTWAFTPRLFERRGFVSPLLTAALCSLVSLWSYGKIFPHSTVPVLGSLAFLGALLGQQAAREIWGSVNTFVVGPGWARVLEVPSYVLIFFWLFYVFVGTLLLGDPFRDPPMVYWLPCSGLVLGFVADFLIKRLFARRPQASAQSSDTP